MKKNSSGYHCEMVNKVRMCVPFDEYLKNGFILTNAKSYEEIFGVKL